MKNVQPWLESHTHPYPHPHTQFSPHTENIFLKTRRSSAQNWNNIGAMKETLVLKKRSAVYASQNG